MSNPRAYRIADPARSRAVLIGVADHDHLSDLPAVTSSVKALADVLGDERVWGLPPENCTVLLDIRDRRELGRVLAAAAGSVGHDGLLLTYFAGHAFVYADGSLLLGLANTTASGEAGMPYESVRRTMVGRRRAGNNLVILDCCNADSAIAPDLDDAGTSVLAAIAADEAAIAPAGEPLTLFTGELVRLLRAGLPGGPLLLDLETMQQHLDRRLTVRRPDPVRCHSTFDPSWALFRNHAAFFPQLGPYSGRTLGELPDSAALELGVHSSANPGDELPQYIRRDHDSVLRAAIADATRGGGLIAVVGESKAGKTRSAWEAVRELLPGWTLWQPRNVDDFAAGAPVVPAHTVVWLDSAITHLSVVTSGNLAAEAIEHLLHAAEAPVVIFVVADSIDWAALTVTGPPRLRTLLRRATVIGVHAVLTAQERARAAAIGSFEDLGSVFDAAEAGPAPNHEGSVATRGYGDRPTDIDMLQRDAMVGALADLISPQPSASRDDDDAADRSGPTVIALDGPWGLGKTSLVKMIQRRLDAVPRPTTPGAQAEPLRVYEADRALRGRGGPVWHRGMMARAESDGAHAPLVQARFEPWSYQTGEQVWAGLTSTLLDAVGKVLLPPQTPATDRYWFHRNLDRIDRVRARRALRRGLVSPVLAVSVLALLVPIVAQLARSLDDYEIAGRWLIAGSNISLFIAVLAVLVGAWHTAYRYWRRPAVEFLPADLFAGPVPSSTFAVLNGGDEALRDPYYQARSGYLYLAQHDVMAVLDDVKASKHQLVVFIDDLDRCVPRTTVEVFEAVNVFVNRTFPVTRFVLCLDAAAVAAQLDEAYPALKATPLRGGDPTTGWSFLRKLIQLPVILPRISADVMPDLLDQLLRSTGGDPVDAATQAVSARPTGELTPTTDVPAVVATDPPHEATPVPAVEDAAPSGMAATGSLVESAVNEISTIIENHVEVRARLLERLGEQPDISVRETKRIITVWQYYVRVLIRLDGPTSPKLFDDARNLVILAEIVARWPAAQRAVHRRIGGVHGLGVLAEAVDDHARWAQTLRRLDLQGDSHGDCADNLRELLRRYDGAEIGALAARFT